MLAENRIRYWEHQKDYRAWKEHFSVRPKKMNPNAKKMGSKCKSKGDYNTSDILKIQSDPKGLLLTILLKEGSVNFQNGKLKHLRLKASTPSEFVVWSDSLAEETQSINVS